MRIDDPVYQPTGSWWTRFLDALILAVTNWGWRQHEGSEEVDWFDHIDRLVK